MNEISKSLKGLEKGLSGAVFLIDENTGFVEIDGDKDLKTFLYEVTPYLLSRWKEREKKCIPEKIPEGAKCWLPYLPPCGVDNLTATMVEVYWKGVMRLVLTDKGRDLGYETKE